MAIVAIREAGWINIRRRNEEFRETIVSNLIGYGND